MVFSHSVLSVSLPVSLSLCLSLSAFLPVCLSCICFLCVCVSLSLSLSLCLSLSVSIYNCMLVSAPCFCVFVLRLWLIFVFLALHRYALLCDPVDCVIFTVVVASMCSSQVTGELCRCRCLLSLQTLTHKGIMSWEALQQDFESMPQSHALAAQNEVLVWLCRGHDRSSSAPCCRPRHAPWRKL